MSPTSVVDISISHSDAMLGEKGDVAEKENVDWTNTIFEMNLEESSLTRSREVNAVFLSRRPQSAAS